VYRHIPHADIIEALIHIRDVFRRIRPSNEDALRADERREATIKDLLSNLPRTNQHPTLKTVLEIAETCCLTLEGAHVKGRVKPGHCGGVKLGQLVATKLLDLRGRRAS
jgi:hypothetical protein